MQVQSIAQPQPQPRHLLQPLRRQQLQVLLGELHMQLRQLLHHFPISISLALPQLPLHQVALFQQPLSPQHPQHLVQFLVQRPQRHRLVLFRHLLHPVALLLQQQQSPQQRLLHQLLPLRLLLPRLLHQHLL